MIIWKFYNLYMFKVWDGIISPVYVRSWWYPKSIISKSRAFQWYIICMIIWKLYNLYMFKVWDVIISPVYVRSWWYPKPIMSKSRAFQWYITCMIIWKFYNLYMFKVWGLRWYNFTYVCQIMMISEIYDLQIKSFPMIYQMYDYLKIL